MNIGSLRHRISLYYIGQIEESGGPNTYTNLTKITDLWGKVEALSGLVRFDTKQIGEELTHKITVRFYKGLSAQNWLKYYDPTSEVTRNFEIKNIKNIDERNQYLELLVKEVFNDEDDFEAGTGTAGEALEE